MLILVCGTLAGKAAGLIIVDERHWHPPIIPPHPIPRPVHVYSPLELKSLEVECKVNDQVATAHLKHEFHNPNPIRMEGSFLLPLPKGAQVERFTLEIDGKETDAELLRADKARGIYEDIVRRSKDPALLEYAGRDLLRLRVFPIEPRSSRKISLRYTHLLESDSGLTRLTLPLSGTQFSREPVGKTRVTIELASTKPLKTLYSPSHELKIDRQGQRRAKAELRLQETARPTDLALYFSSEQDAVGVSLLTHREAGEDGYFVLLASPGVETDALKTIPKDVVFVIDTSGSMAGKKMEQAQNALRFCVESLNAEDNFEIVRFSTEAEVLFEQLKPANKGSKKRALEFIDGLKAAGGTAIDAALEKALAARPEYSLGRRAVSSRPLVVIFLTDGRPTVGTTNPEQILGKVEKKVDGGMRIFCFGVGTDVNTHLLDKIGQKARGYTQYVLPEEDLEIKVSDFFAKINHPVLASPQLKFGGDIRVTKTYPSPLPDLFRGSQLVVVGRYSGSGDSEVKLEGTVGDSQERQRYELEFPKKSTKNDFVPRLWAMRRVGFLLDEIRLHGDNEELKQEVTELAREYGIVTPYTAYLIVEDEEKREVPESSRSLDRFQQDTEARRTAEASWREYKSMDSGLGAVAAARSSTALSTAQAPDAAGATVTMEANRGFGMGPADTGSSASTAPARARVADYAQQTRFVSGKSFFNTGEVWLDAEVQKHPDAKVISVKFGTKEYFDLVQRVPEAGRWLSLGPRIKLYVDGNIYDVSQ